MINVRGAGETRENATLVSDMSTIFRHFEVYHEVSVAAAPFRRSSLRRATMADTITQDAYRAWCKKTGFPSKLPADRNKQSGVPVDVQTTLDPHLQPVVKYSDTLFRNAAIEWLIATDQVMCQSGSRNL